MHDRRVLFLCTGNYYRSRLAEELFNQRAHQLGLHWHASSCALAKCEIESCTLREESQRHESVNRNMGTSTRVPGANIAPKNRITS